MLLDVVTASSDAQLTTTAAVKLLLGTTATSDDGLLDALISRASAWAESVLGYPASAQGYLELVPGYGSRRLMLARTPVRAVQGLYAGTDSGDYLQVYSSEFALDREAGLVERNIGWDWTVPVTGDLSPWPQVGQEFPDWRVEYVAGWTLGGIDTGSALWSTAKGTTSTARTLPRDVEDAIVTKVIDWYDGSEGVLEKQVGDLRLKYASVGSASNPLVQDRALSILERYRRWV